MCQHYIRDCANNCTAKIISFQCLKKLSIQTKANASYNFTTYATDKDQSLPLESLSLEESVIEVTISMYLLYDLHMWRKGYSCLLPFVGYTLEQENFPNGTLCLYRDWRIVENPRKTTAKRDWKKKSILICFRLQDQPNSKEADKDR